MSVYCATIGFFDGVHRGHRYVLQSLREISVAKSALPLIVSFREHPQTFFSQRSVPLLTLPKERLRLLEREGEVLMLSFADIYRMTAKQFMEYLYQRSVRYLVLGYDHRFGSDRLTTLEQYKAVADEVGMQVVQLCEYPQDHTHISSTVIRRLLQAGEVAEANRLLGYHYTLTGVVVGGKQLGRQLGFPTANLSIAESKMIPQEGVYSAKITLTDKTIKNGILNIGTNPTVGGEERTCEVFIVDFKGDLYGQTIQVELNRHIREEKKFDTLDALRQQIQNDLQSI